MIAAAEEERLTRVKHTKAFLAHAIGWCLTEAGIDAQDLDRVALFVDPKLQLLLPATNLWRGFPASLGSLGSDLDKYLLELVSDPVAVMAETRRSLRAGPAGPCGPTPTSPPWSCTAPTRR